MNDREIYLEPLSIHDVPEVYELYTNALVLQNYSSKPIEKYCQTAGFIANITTEGCRSWKTDDFLLAV
nr:hypothetical protein [Cytophagales bacterium]